jgi:hypothetical protein
MRKHLARTAFLCLLATTTITSAKAQTANGTGTAVSGSNSESGAIAIAGGGRGGNSSLVINNPADTTSTVNQTVSGTTTSNINQRVSGSQTVKSNPSMAMGLTAAGLETCLGSASGGLSLAGLGLMGGSTYTDEGCQARLDARTLASFGLKAAAVARLCARADIWRSMPDICQRYWPASVALPYGIAVASPGNARAEVTMSVDGNAVRVVDGRDGVEKDCLSYNHTKQRCYHWAGEQPRRQKSASLTPANKPMPTMAKPKIPTPPVQNATTKVEPPKAAEPKAEEKKS